MKLGNLHLMEFIFYNVECNLFSAHSLVSGVWTVNPASEQRNSVTTTRTARRSRPLGPPASACRRNVKSASVQTASVTRVVLGLIVYTRVGRVECHVGDI